MFPGSPLPFFVSPEMPKAWANKTGFNIMILHFYIRRNLDYNTADINRFRSHTVKVIKMYFSKIRIACFDL